MSPKMINTAPQFKIAQNGSRPKIESVCFPLFSQTPKTKVEDSEGSRMSEFQGADQTKTAPREAIESAYKIQIGEQKLRNWKGYCKKNQKSAFNGNFEFGAKLDRACSPGQRLKMLKTTIEQRRMSIDVKFGVQKNPKRESDVTETGISEYVAGSVDICAEQTTVNNTKNAQAKNSSARIRQDRSDSSKRAFDFSSSFQAVNFSFKSKSLQKMKSRSKIPSEYNEVQAVKSTSHGS